MDTPFEASLWANPIIEGDELEEINEMRQERLKKEHAPHGVLAWLSRKERVAIGLLKRLVTLPPAFD